MQLCEQNGAECKTCNGKNCNYQSSFTTCLECNSANNRKCATNPQSMGNKVCKRYHDNCFTHIGRHNITRGCVEENGIDIDACRNNPRKCEVCTTIDGLPCNSQSIQLDVCVDCDSALNPECRNGSIYAFVNKLCSSMEQSPSEGCYLRVDGDHYERGCLADLPTAWKASCQSQSDTCKTCTGKNCNIAPNFQQCIECNSKFDITCAQNATLKPSKTCENYISTCVTGIDEDGHIHRRCNEQHNDENVNFPNGMFHVCEENNCNTEIFPETRLQCYQCDGEKKCDFMSAENTPKLVPCGIFSEYDQCFTYLGEGM